jgi:lipopolysaccharide/colanic/teichoic acid biosynthesis glycosyltransferase
LIRLLDILIAILVLIIAFPFVVILLVFLIFKGSPIIFKQTRVGKNFKPFILYKFRTMKMNAEDKYGVTLGEKDHRITKTGKWLRYFKLDEIPQLLNVLKGDMSIVGPRPQVPYYTSKFKEDYNIILQEKPGLLSYASIDFIDEDKLMNPVANKIEFFEKELLPKKCNLDKELVGHFNTKTYFKVMGYFIRKIGLKIII